MDERKVRERTAQNKRFSTNGGSRGSVDRAYYITRASHEYFRERLAADAAGRRLLEIGCGAGSNLLNLCARGAVITGIDLSDVAIKNARDEALRRGVKTARFAVMDAEEMAFPEDSFDIVCGGAILHHLALERALPEIARILTSRGYALFIEPLGYNPLINLYRKLTPKLRTPDEHPLLARDLERMRRSFAAINVRYHYLTTLLALPIAHTAIGQRITSALNAVDSVLFKVLPALRKYAWIVVIELRQPLKDVKTPIQPGGTPLRPSVEPYSPTRRRKPGRTMGV